MLHTSTGSKYAGSFGTRRPVLLSCRTSRGSLQVQNALTRTKKEQVVERLKGKLNDSVIVFGVRIKGLDVAAQQKFRRGLPEKSSMVVCKNTLMTVACQDSGNWTTVIDQKLKGDNAWIFVHEDEIAEVIKHYFAFSGELEKEARAAAPKDAKDIPLKAQVSCAVMDNKYLTPAELKRCENLPSKKQLYATIARLLKQPAQKLAVGIKQVPSKLAYGIKALAELDEDKTKLVGDVAKPKAA